MPVEQQQKKSAGTRHLTSSLGRFVDIRLVSRKPTFTIDRNGLEAVITRAFFAQATSGTFSGGHQGATVSTLNSRRLSSGLLYLMILISVVLKLLLRLK